VFDVDPVALLTREVLRERTPALVAETCAWSVGLSDAPHHVRRHGRVVATGDTLGARAATGQQLSVEEDLRLELGEVVPGSLADALGALTADGSPQADRFDVEVLTPFVLETCVEAAGRARQAQPQAWAELLDDLGEDGDDLAAVVRAAEWDAPLRIDAEQLVLAAVGHAPLVEVEAEGLPLSLVRAAEAETRRAAGVEQAPSHQGEALREEELAGALFLADAALSSSGLAQPVAPDDAGPLLAVLLDEGLEPDEVLAVLPHLPVLADTADAVAAEVDQRPPGPA
jgi:hypothetical protein